MGGVVEPECLAFEKHSVVVDQYGTVNEFECSLTVVLEVADGVEGVGVVAFGLDLEAQFYGLPFGNFVAVWHDFHRERIGLLHVEVVGAGGQVYNDCDESNPEPEETGGCEAGFADFVDDCFHDFQSLSFVDFFG